MCEVVIDAEASGLLPMADKVHIVVVRQIGTGYTKRFFDADSLKKAIPKFTKVVGQNLIGYDLPLLRSLWGIDFSIGAKQDTWNGTPVEFIDTLHLSQLLNPDRVGGHSVENWSKMFGKTKVGKDIVNWSVYTDEMGDRCENDTEVTEDMINYLLKEASERMTQ